ncbi:ABC transporter permease [Pseudomonas typographi]|uniref:ABC transporter permease n=1 Tax=Pseudomonas typographi TaxID=2715964 RepID=A0ABR7ZAF2_9PSED|nr:ABC transporter permease [Pseudomonas typographi]MBD1555172.1 ABC transporter permease [Pseudomonas typographi]MBD1589967.1 ABC transporter permease [Pseudomonas typographi]MBD1602362.1 ABC transporter permease [Pseudomonas typographi]
MRVGLDDIISGVRRRDVWLYFAFSDTRARYARSVLGPWWITLGTAIGVIGLGMVWSSVMKINLSEMLPNLAVGLVIWFFLSGVISESSACYVNQSSLIKNYNLPLFTHNLRLISKHAINFLHNLAIVFVVFVIYGWPSGTNALWSLLGLLILFANLIWVSVVLSILGARFRDLGASIDALMPILFFLTPILYKKSDILGSSAWLDYNPIAMLFSIVKSPLAGEIDFYSYIIMAAVAIIGWFVAFSILSAKKQKVVFWV